MRSAPAASVGPASASLTSNLTAFSGNGCTGALAGQVCAAESLIAVVGAEGCDMLYLARVLQRAGCSGAIVPTPFDPPGVGFTFEEPREQRLGGGAAAVQIHGVSLADASALRALALARSPGGGGGGAVARLCKSPELVQANPWNRVGRGAVYVGLLRVVMPATFWLLACVGCTRLARKCGDVSWRRSHAPSRNSIWGVPIAPTVLALETLAVLVAALRGTLIAAGEYSPLDNESLRTRIGAAMLASTSTALIVVFWHDAFSLKSVGRRSARLRLLLILAIVAPFLLLYLVTALKLQPVAYLTLRVWVHRIVFVRCAAARVHRDHHPCRDLAPLPIRRTSRCSPAPRSSTAAACARSCSGASTSWPSRAPSRAARPASAAPPAPVARTRTRAPGRARRPPMTSERWRRTTTWPMSATRPSTTEGRRSGCVAPRSALRRPPGCSLLGPSVPDA